MKHEKCTDDDVQGEVIGHGGLLKVIGGTVRIYVKLCNSFYSVKMTSMYCLALHRLRFMYLIKKKKKNIF